MMPPDCTTPVSRLAKRGMTFVAALAALGQAQAQLAPPPPPPKTNITINDGRSLTGWKVPLGDWKLVQSARPSAGNPKAFTLVPGLGTLVNGDKGRTGNLFSNFQHGDVRAVIEYMVPKGSNSGVYFQGRYEIQILDSHGKKTLTSKDNGAIYELVVNGKGVGGNVPVINASKAPGEWQKLIVTFRAPRFDATGKKVENARFVKVTLNGQLIHHNVEAPAPTRGSRFKDEKPTGPIMLQGDHGPVAFRKVILKPVKLD